MDSLSVCIVNWNTRSDLQTCLEALHTNPYSGGPQEIIVVDNASADGSTEMVRAIFPGVRLIANTANRNYAPATNQALAAATGDCLLLLNPDARMTEGALDTLVRFLKTHPEAGAVAARLVHEDGTVQRSVRGFPEPLSVLWDLLRLPRLLPGLGTYRQVKFDYSKAGPAPQPMTSCFLVTRSAYEKVGPMDERFPLYFNDVDWCLRAKKAGIGIWYTPEATAIHGYGGTTKTVRKAAIWESHRALLRLWRKHYRETTPRVLYVIMKALVTLGAWMRTGRWGKSLGKDGGETTPENLHRELDARDDLRICLNSITIGTAHPETVDIWVVDNASSDGSADMVAREFPNVRLIRSAANEGFSGGNNHLLKDLDADYALLLNSDAICHPGSLDTLLDWADVHPGAGIMGPKVLNTDSSLQFSCRRFPTFAAGLFRNVYLGRLFPNNKPAADYLMQDFDHNSVRDVDWVSGCVLLIRRTCLEKIGLLDAETFFMYCEDMDWCLRAHNENWGVVYVPDAVFTHAIGKSSNNAAERMIVAHHRSMWRFYKKHQAFFDQQIPPMLRPLVPLGIGLRVAVRIGRRRYINPLLNLVRGKKQDTSSEQNVQQASNSTG